MTTPTPPAPPTEPSKAEQLKVWLRTVFVPWVKTTAIPKTKVGANTAAYQTVNGSKKVFKFLGKVIRFLRKILGYLNLFRTNPGAAFAFAAVIVGAFVIGSWLATNVWHTATTVDRWADKKTRYGSTSTSSPFVEESTTSAAPSPASAEDLRQQLKDDGYVRTSRCGNSVHLDENVPASYWKMSGICAIVQGKVLYLMPLNADDALTKYCKTTGGGRPVGEKHYKTYLNKQLTGLDQTREFREGSAVTTCG